MHIAAGRLVTGAARLHARGAAGAPSGAGARTVACTVAGVVAATALAAPVAAHGPAPAEAPSLASILLGWSFEPLVLLPLIAAGVGWWRLLAAVDRAHPEHPVAPLRRWSFLAALVVIAVALQSGLERYDTTLFSLHMVQHLLLTLVAPPLLALAAPVTQVLRAASPETRTRWLLPVLHARLVRVVGHPLVAWLAFTAVMWATHFSPLFDAALESSLLHDLEHVLYLGAGLLFWWPVLGLDPAPHRMSHPARLLYLFLQMPQNSFLAMALLFAASPLYPHYVTLGAPYGIDALADQRLAAGIMWFVGDVIFLAAVLAVLAGWMRSEERGSAAAERHADVERGAIRDREAIHRERRRLRSAAPATAAGTSGPAAGAGSGRAVATGLAEDPGQSGTGEASSSR